MWSYLPHSPQVIKSARQSALFALWDRLRGASALPLWSAFDAAHFSDWFESMVFLRVLRPDLRFEVLARGRLISKMFGPRCSFRYLDLMLPEADRAEALDSYYEAVRKKFPIYTVSEKAGSSGLRVLYQRLLLPVASGGDQVTHILGSFEVSAPAPNGFDSTHLFSANLADKYLLKAGIKINHLRA